MVWLGRINHCRGFGVQSPTDYRFVRYVINEHYPYYKYKDLENEFPEMDSLERKLCMLYFRLSNYCQASYFVDFMREDECAAYVKAACCSTNRVAGENDSLPKLEIGKTFLARIDCRDDALNVYNKLLDKATEKSVIVVQDIKDSRQSRRIWQRMTDDNRVGVAYDLYYCGIIISDKRRYKNKYIINF